MRFARTSHRYRHRRDRQEFLRMRIKEIAAARVRYGYLRIHVLLRREGWKINLKRVYRLYTEENLQMRRKAPHRHVSSKRRIARPAATRANETWSMDFMSDSLGDGRKLRVLTIVDNFTRESLASEVSQRISGHDVARVLTRISVGRGMPRTIRVDNGPEFISRALDQWAYLNKVELDFSRPGKPTDNALIESFNGRLREECLNQNWFVSLEDARRVVEAWRREYNEERPHGSLGNLAPGEFALLSQGNPAKSKPASLI
jgi:putative transposase